MTRLADRVPVEPLSSERVQRIEDRVATAFSRARTEAPVARGRRAWLLGCAVTAVAAAALAFVVLRPRPTSVGAAPTRVVTPAGEGATLSIGDASVVFAGGSAAEIVQGAAGGVEIALYVGRVDCEVAPRPRRPPFTVIAGEVEVQVVGTVFAVERDDEVRVTVTRGEVRVTATGAETAVAAGEQWSQPVATRAPLPRWALAAAEAPRVAMVEPAAAPGSAAEAPAPDDDDDERGVGEAPSAVDAPKPARDGADDPVRRKRKPTAEPEPAEVEPTPGDTLPRPYAGAPPTERFQRLRELEDSDLDGAIAEYMKSLTGDGAEYVLFRLAYVEYTKRRRTRQAIRWAEAVEKRFPKGKYAAHAHWLRIHALHGAGNKSACRAAAQSYLRRYSDGAHREHARRLMDWY